MASNAARASSASRSPLASRIKEAGSPLASRIKEGEGVRAGGAGRRVGGVDVRGGGEAGVAAAPPMTPPRHSSMMQALAEPHPVPHHPLPRAVDNAIKRITPIMNELEGLKIDREQDLQKIEDIIQLARGGLHTAQVCEQLIETEAARRKTEVTLSHKMSTMLQSASDQLATSGSLSSVAAVTNSFAASAPPRSQADVQHQQLLQHFSDVTKKLRAHDAETERNARNITAMLRSLHASLSGSGHGLSMWNRSGGDGSDRAGNRMVADIPVAFSPSQSPSQSPSPSSLLSPSSVTAAANAPHRHFAASPLPPTSPQHFPPLTLDIAAFNNAHSAATTRSKQSTSRSHKAAASSSPSLKPLLSHAAAAAYEVDVASPVVVPTSLVAPHIALEALESMGQGIRELFEPAYVTSNLKDLPLRAVFNVARLMKRFVRVCLRTKRVKKNRTEEHIAQLKASALYCSRLSRTVEDTKAVQAALEDRVRMFSNKIAVQALLQWQQAVVLQKVYRGHIQRRRVARLNSAVLRLQKNYRMIRVQKRFRWQKLLQGLRRLKKGQDEWRQDRAIFSRVCKEEEELLKWYTKAESIAAEVAASTQKTRAEFAAKAAGVKSAHMKQLLSDSLPPQWVPQLGTCSGQTYYYNVETQRSQQEHPNMMHVGLAIMAKLEQHKAKLEARIMKQSACIDDMRLEEVGVRIRVKSLLDRQQLMYFERLPSADQLAK